MIKKRNLDPSLINWIMNQTGIGPGIGEIFFVAPASSATSQYRTQLQSMGIERDNVIYTEPATAIAATEDYRNDVVLIYPGTYTTGIADDLNAIHLLGLGATPRSVKIAPTGASSYAGTLQDSVVKGISFYSPSSTSTTYAAFRALKMYGSIVDNCYFYAGAVADTSTAFRIGTEAGSVNYDRMLGSRFTNNLIGTLSGGKNFYYGICFGKSAPTDANSRYTYMQDSVIAHNTIGAEFYGIMMGVIYTTGSNAIIAHNNVHGGLLSSGQCAEAGIRAYDRGHDNKLIKVYDNRISAHTPTTAIVGFSKQNIMGNIVGEGGGDTTPTGEWPLSA